MNKATVKSVTEGLSGLAVEDPVESRFSGKIVFIHNTTKYLYLHYREFIERFVDDGAEVIVIAPFDSSVTQMQQYGIRCIDFRISRQGMNPFAEIATLFKYYRILKREKPHIVFNYSIKPVIYGSIAARLAGVENVFSMVTGLGHLFMDQTVHYKIIRAIILPLYRIAIKYNRRVFFQNPDDSDLFIEYGLIDDQKSVVTNGTGIDLNDFCPETECPVATSFILIARLLWSKGIKEYVEAARALKEKYPDAEFRIVGMYDDNPTSIRKDQMEAWQDEGTISYLGEANDVRPFLRESSVFVLPTIYREGRPRAVVEAMAVGKPIITTDTPGCRHTVSHGENGFLVPKQNSRALTEAMERFILDPDLAKQMGVRSRALAEEMYDVHKINDDIRMVMKRGLD